MLAAERARETSGEHGRATSSCIEHSLEMRSPDSGDEELGPVFSMCSPLRETETEPEPTWEPLVPGPAFATGSAVNQNRSRGLSAAEKVILLERSPSLVCLMVNWSGGRDQQAGRELGWAVSTDGLAFSSSKLPPRPG